MRYSSYKTKNKTVMGNVYKMVNITMTNLFHDNKVLLIHDSR